ncbi:hypothetical protein HU200_058350 [Digitaria exilis]|uniref:Oxidoreductase N-terminal domain-containing protein n=1 Tax=Digitaria exilis TaxID=1010633 RepID=A0A835E232_9POAL|nr:hypothetical protein HU200_058350 [Digitaria exilis]
MAEEVRNRKVVLKRYVTGYPTEDDMEVVDGTIHLAVPAGLAAPAVLVKNLYLSCDAWMRGRMSKRDDVTTVVNDFVLGEAMRKVVESTHTDYQAGDLEYTLITHPSWLVKIQHTELPLSYYTGVLASEFVISVVVSPNDVAGMSGLTAYAGFFDVCKPKPGEAVFVSAASGAVGQLVGQLAKLAGCHVALLLKTKLGFHDAINYKSEPDLGASLRLRFPDGIDTLDAALPLMRLRGRVAVCGMVSQYSLDDPGQGVRMRNLPWLVTRRVRMEGFNVDDYLADKDYYRRFEEAMAGYLRDGRVTYLEDVVEGLENAPAALVGIFRGRNVGRQLIVVARE